MGSSAYCTGGRPEVGDSQAGDAMWPKEPDFCVLLGSAIVLQLAFLTIGTPNTMSKILCTKVKYIL